MCAAGAHASVSPAGADIRNVASARFEIDGTEATILSNAVTARVDEILDIELAPKSEGAISLPPSLPDRFGAPFVLTNSGNGVEAFDVEASVRGQAAPLSVVIDVDGDGIYDPDIDEPLATGQTPPLRPGARLNLLVRLDSAPGAAGTIELRASAATGSGAVAGIYAGRGDAGADAIVGHTTAMATAVKPFLIEGAINSETAPAKLTKSQVIEAPDGSNAPTQGATITYRLELVTTGASPLLEPEIVDVVPGGTAYVPGSIHLNGSSISDADDADAGLFDGTAIRVGFNDISQPTTQVVTFQVKVL